MYIVFLKIIHYVYLPKFNGERNRMKILQPHKISTEIIDIIYEAKKQLIIVSPYVNFSNWERIASELRNAKNRGVQIDFFVRNEPENSKSWEQVSALGIEPKLVSNLHAKFYFNEKNGLISSMNLLSSSNSNSIEIGVSLDEKNEIDELKRFLNDFILPNTTNSIPDEDDLFISKEKFIVVLESYILGSLNTKTHIKYKDGTFDINVFSNRFTLEVDKVKNLVSIMGILSSSQADLFEKQHPKFFTSKYFDYDLERGDDRHYNVFWADSKVRLSNSYLDNLRVNEKKELIFAIVDLFENYKNFRDASISGSKN